MIPQRTERVKRLVRRTGWGGLLLAGALLVTPMGCYLSRAAYEEARILARREPIAHVVARDGTDPALRAKLQLVLEARQFAIDSLGLSAGKSFTAFSQLDRDTLVLVLSASYRDRLERKTWWFPVVGRFPYKGFFDFGDAARTAEQLRGDGFDVLLGASSAFSTLGWFNDPLVSPTVKADSVTLVNTVLHELLHSTFFAKGQVSFNESFASFVGGRGAEHFFRARGDSVRYRRAVADWQDDLLLGAFWERTANALDSGFAIWPDSVHGQAARPARLAARDTVFARARRMLVDSIGPRLTGYPPGWTARVPLDNAVVMARRVYAEGLEGFDAVYAANGGDLKAAIRAVIEGRNGGLLP